MVMFNENRATKWKQGKMSDGDLAPVGADGTQNKRTTTCVPT